MEHNKRVEQIKTYLERLSAGEELEKVRADFAKEFKAVDPAEIMQAEQELLQGGTPLETVQKLCDVHAALFRGATSEEKVANAEKAVAASVKEKKLAATAALTGITGHPLQTFTRENEDVGKRHPGMQERNRGNQYPFTGAVWKAAGSCDPLCKERGSSVSASESKIRDQRPVGCDVDNR